ncbi:hypothetical protein [Vitiosangium sp. GDMCC 1.1324]|uniref:hypothetical protein n=1 Tax=Vitiosangium sp. (strain GDMCC 1.1324) TaxID=2138576 RepID=UPI000D39551F|nr:hypothetical protein [Vitiosangium sp. GDMCC 1.1324]PTL77074.1 hypothetical protein DAT35_46370 [Vitiosangium sp. GDMCC 1.1324]
MEGHEVSRLGELTLAWLLTRDEGKGARSDLSRALKPFAEHRWSASDWSQRLDETLAALESGGLALRTARNGLELTAQGRTHAHTWLGVKRLPEGTTWKKLKATHLLARVLELTPSASSLTRLGTADGMRAVLVQKELGLESPGSRSLTQVRDALCWKQLGVDTDKPFTLAAVQAVLLARALQTSREAEPTQAMRQLAARSVGAKRSDAESLRLAALRSWLVPSSEPVAPPPSVPTPSSTRNELASAPQPALFEPAAPVPQEDLPTFAERVRQAAKDSASGRFGEDKIFISHVWRTLRGQFQGLDEQTFKNRLVEANRAQLLSLSRADLVEAMDPGDVAESETRYLGATFHFIAL